MKNAIENLFQFPSQMIWVIFDSPSRLIQTNMSPKNPTCLMFKQININHPITFLFRTEYRKRYNSLHWLYPNLFPDSMPHLLEIVCPKWIQNEVGDRIIVSRLTMLGQHESKIDGIAVSFSSWIGTGQNPSWPWHISFF